MSENTIASALETPLATWATANGYTVIPEESPEPTDNKAYAYPVLVPAEGTGEYDSSGDIVLNRGLFRVRLSRVIDNYTTSIRAVADSLAVSYKRGTNLTLDGITVESLLTWTSAVTRVDSRIEIVLNVRWRAFVESE